MKKDYIREALHFEDLTPEEKEKRGILGRLYGPCASISIPTRNGRFYSEALFNNQFENNEILKELIENGGIPMELDHPEDREETCSDKIAAMMPELPKKDKDGHLICYIDILDTPCGKIAYQLAKYGFKLGISSRGTGDLITDDEGNESVDPDTYNLTTFDLVLIPAVKDARLTMVESLNTNEVKFKKALKESLESSSETDRKVMTETLKDLKINIDSLNENVNSDSDKATDNGLKEIVTSLQESLKTNKELQSKIRDLQDKLAVSDSKVKELSEEVNRVTSTNKSLTEKMKTSKDLSSEVLDLNKQIESKNNEISSLQEKLNNYVSKFRETKKNLSESLRKANFRRDDEIKSLNESLATLNESISEKDETIKSLNEDIQEMKANSELKNSEYKQKIEKASKVLESYKRNCNEAISRYIDLKADYLGVSSKDIKNRLPENYTMKDVDSICESLQDYQLTMSKLPFSVNNTKGKVRVGIKSNGPAPKGVEDDGFEELLEMTKN